MPELFKVITEYKTKQSDGWQRDPVVNVVAESADKAVAAAIAESKRTDPRDSKPVQHRLAEVIHLEGIDLMAV